MDARYQVIFTSRHVNHQRQDLDNVEKLLNDALNGIVWSDDSQVDEVHKWRLPPSKTEAGLHVTIRPL